MKIKVITTRLPNSTGNPSFIFTFLHKKDGFHSAAGNANATSTDRFNQTHSESDNLIQTRCKSGKIRKDEAFGYFDSMIQTKPLPSIWTFNCLFGALSKMKEYSAVVSMCKQLMGCAQFRPDVCTMNIVLNCLCRLNRVDLGFSVLATTLKYGLQPDAHSMSILLHGLCKYKEKGYTCDEITYATMINGLCKAGKTSKALEILTNMLEDVKFKPKQGCYNPIIDCLCKEGQIDEEERIQEALTLLENMTTKGIKPDVVTFTSLISASCKSGNWEEGVRFFKTMIGYGALPNIVTYNAVLNALCKKGKTAEALNLVEEMISSWEKPDVVTYSSLINGLCRTSQLRESTRVFNRMLDEGIAPNVITYNSLIHGMCRTAQWEEATRLFDDMVGRGLLPNAVTLVILLDAICKGGMTEETHKIFEATIEYGMKLSTITCSMLVSEYCLQGRMDKAKVVLNLMVIMDYAPDIASYKTLVNGYISVDRIGEVLRLVKEMIQIGLMPDLEMQQTLGRFRRKSHIGLAG
ncbi:pentatricopeptide repeat-containing protein [Pyrus ussuriensis x Pyrus communis]|uniref:Pentatricopeptide repeat-containing protein n=1 Tax=Pyrus ussuriensis x Pyrus communis TaxID=2448454 RepID=A0A5N5H679_9ROSA|nr:pentatricopeptide repeat-containing protein [Pyrus ussuriensis x Pyrus communis]